MLQMQKPPNNEINNSGVRQGGFSFCNNNNGNNKQTTKKSNAGVLSEAALPVSFYYRGRKREWHRLKYLRTFTQWSH